MHRIWCIPPIPPLADKPTQRIHRPTGDYANYRNCLRWEFGFTCSICLLHEASIAPRDGRGVEGWAVTSIEHLTAQSADVAQRNAYSNCVYACYRCNTVRNKLTRDGLQSGILLDPCTHGWSTHFVVAVDSEKMLLLLDSDKNDKNAKYTANAYGINAPDRAATRFVRYQRIKESFIAIEEDLQMLRDLEESISDDRCPFDLKAKAAGMVVIVRKQLQRNLQTLSRTARAVPNDAPADCGCSQTRKLPQYIASSLILITYEEGNPGSVTISKSPVGP